MDPLNTNFHNPYDFKWCQERVDEYEDKNPYYIDGFFITIHDFIYSFESPIHLFDDVYLPQLGLVECVIHDLDSQPFEVERNIVQTALSELDNVMKMNLVKISNATHFRDKLEDREIKLVEDAFSHNNGKWFFQPDQRSRTETFFIQKDPCIARNVLPFKEWSELNNSTKGEN